MTYRRAATLSRLRGLLAVIVAATVCACGSDDTAATPPQLAVLSAFPGEIEPLVAQATITQTEMLDENRVARIGRLGGMPVILALTGIGLVNAANTTKTVIERFGVTGIVVSAVAGSTVQIGDVVVPMTWRFMSGSSYGTQPEWFDLASAIADSGTVSLDRCTTTPDFAPGQLVCMLQQPVIVVGGFGQSADTFGVTPYPCEPGGNDIMGCDIPTDSTSAAAGDPRDQGLTNTAADQPIVRDMETAAIAREAAAHGVKFIAFRAVSDGAGDPLGLPPFPSQFVAYYRLAAHNAAAMTVAFLERLGDSAGSENARLAHAR